MTPRGPAPWLSLFAPLPPDARPRRQPVGSPLIATAPDSPIAGWESLLLDLSDPPFGSRIVLVTLDASSRPISASDHVVLRDVDGPWADPLVRVHMRQSSLGGRIEDDGSFRGTYWAIEGPEPEDEELPQWQQSQRAPTEEEVAKLLALVRDIIARPPAP